MALGMRREVKKEVEERTIEINAEMQGTLSFKDPVNLKINGTFNGGLETHGTLTIGSTANVVANIQGDNIVVAGKIRGDIVAHKMLVLMPTSVLNGNITTPKLNIVEGAVFQGHCQMKEEYLDLEEVAKYLEIEKPTIIELANTGKIPAQREGDQWRFERIKIDEWASSGKLK